MVLIVCVGQVYLYVSLGWEIFIDKVIVLINEYCEGVVFLLWGFYVQKKGVIIDCQCYCVLKVLYLLLFFVYCGFFGCNYFVQINQWLVDCGEMLIDWMLVFFVESE